MIFHRKFHVAAALPLLLLCSAANAEKPLGQAIEQKIKSAEAQIEQQVQSANEQAKKAMAAADTSECQSVSKKTVNGDVEEITQHQSGNCNSQSMEIGSQKN